MTPTYELTGESFNISGRGTVFSARLTCDCEREELCQLLGQSINNQIIIGIESFAIPNQKKGMVIGFLVQKEKIKMGKEKFTVSWIMVGEKMIKFKEAEEAYDLTESVVAFITKNGLDEKEGIEVEVEIDKSEGDGTVTSLSEVGNTITPAEESVTEEKETKDETSTEETKEAEEDLEVKTLTVSGVAVPNKGVTFKEEKAVWYTLDDSINAQEFKDKYTKKTVEVSIRKTEGDEKNDIITAFTPLAEAEPVDTTDDESAEEPKKGSAYQRSIEGQACMKSAYTIVASMVDTNTSDDKVKDLITLIAEHSYVTLQNLKNKE